MQSRVIKTGGGASASSGGRHSELQLTDFSRLPRLTAETEADIGERLRELVENARVTAGEIIGNTRAEADAIKAQAHEEGYGAGYSAGFADGAEKAAAHASTLIQSLEADISEIERVRNELIGLVEHDIVRLAVTIAEKVIRREARTDKRVVIRAIESVLKRTTLAEEVCVRVNPAEVELVRHGRDELLSVAEGVRSLTVREDRRVPVGGCVVESDAGYFDATINTQIKKIERTLLEACENDRRAA